MKVIVAGHIKTGTKSVAASLTKLGYDVYDLEHHYYHLGREWRKVLVKGGSTEDFRRMYGNVDAAVDVPFSLFWEEIAEAFPDAKIILLQRSSEEVWLRSVQNQVEMFNKHYMFRLLSVLSYTGCGFFRHLALVNRIMFGNHNLVPWNVFNGISPTVAKKRYRDHCNSVLTRAPKDRLLVFNLKDGWEPLCKFLGKEVPDVPFPHENAKGEVVNSWMKENPIFGKMKKEMALSTMMLTAVAGIAIYKLSKSGLMLNLSCFGK